MVQQIWSADQTPMTAVTESAPVTGRPSQICVGPQTEVTIGFCGQVMLALGVKVTCTGMKQLSTPQELVATTVSVALIGPWTSQQRLSLAQVPPIVDVTVVASLITSSIQTVWAPQTLVVNGAPGQVIAGAGV